MNRTIAWSWGATALSLLLTASPTARAEVRDLQVDAVAGEPFGVGRITLDMGGQPAVEPPPRRRLFGGSGIVPPRPPILGEGGVLGKGGLVEGILGEGGLPIDPRLVMEGGLLAEGLLAEDPPPPFFADEEHGRVLYTARMSNNQGRPLRGLIQGVLGGRRESIPATTAYFLFRGDQPFKLRVHLPERFETDVHPRRDEALHRELLAGWWEGYRGTSGLFTTQGDYPQGVENYLRFTLARRLNLPAPREDRPILGGLGRLLGEPTMGSVFAPLLGADDLKRKLSREILLANSGEPLADLPRPQRTPAAPPEVPPAAEPLPEPGAVAEDVAMEEMANYVPEECFYLRFGNFPNFWWLKTLIDRAEGDLGTLFLTSAVKYEISERMQDRLEIRDILFADVIGPWVIKDAAIVGSDAFLREGAAIGFLLRAENSDVLGNFIRGQRRLALKKYDDAVLEDVEVGGRTVSYLHTPDNRVRSYYAVIGDYHFVTTSKTTMARFFEASSGQGSLGKSAEFRQARRQMPLDRRDTMFAYLSSAFFDQLASPHYRVEMMRRLKAHVRMEAAMLAKHAARTEGQPHDTVDQLIEGGFLPRGFNETADGSRIAFVNGKVRDSLRGGYGSMIPVPDVAITQVTAAEDAQYREFVRSYQNDWGRMPAVMVGLKREVEAGGKQDRVKIDLAAHPMTRTPLVMQLAQLMSGGGGLALRFGGDSLIPSIQFGANDPGPGPHENHIHLDDLRDSPVAVFLDPMAQRQASRTLHGSVHFLNSLHDQLGVPVEDCLTTAEQIVDGKLVSATGGEFVLNHDAEGISRWTHAADDSRAGQHAFRPLNWCRSFDARWKLADQELTANLEVLLELPPPPLPEEAVRR